MDHTGSDLGLETCEVESSSFAPSMWLSTISPASTAVTVYTKEMVRILAMQVFLDAQRQL